uniref:Uncharacterized protein n=1 Tax=Oryza meridionalis TaxID=40149 RepID=A0A0E0ES83_9ORYZ
MTRRWPESGGMAPLCLSPLHGASPPLGSSGGAPLLPSAARIRRHHSPTLRSPDSAAPPLSHVMATTTTARRWPGSSGTAPLRLSQWCDGDDDDETSCSDGGS